MIVILFFLKDINIESTRRKVGFGARVESEITNNHPVLHFCSWPYSSKPFLFQAGFSYGWICFIVVFVGCQKALAVPKKTPLLKTTPLIN